MIQNNPNILFENGLLTLFYRGLENTISGNP